MTKKRGKRAAAVLLTTSLLMTAALTGCGNSTGGDNTTSDNGEDLPVITFYHGYFQDEATWAPAVEMRKIYDEFAEANKDKFIFKPVAVETGSQGVYDKCIQEISRGSFPDIVDVAGKNIIPALQNTDIPLDLKPYIDADEDFKAGVGINYEQNEVDGKIYTVRDQLESIGFWYNEDLFEKAGADTPDKWQNWDDFNTAVDKLNACPEVETPFTMNQDWPTSIVMSAHLLSTQEGRDFAAGIPDSFENPAFIDTLDFLQKDVLGKIDNEHFTAADSDKYRQDFYDGKAAMLFTGVWEAGSFTDDMAIDAADIKPAVFPTNEAGTRAAIVSASPGFVINGNQDQAKIDACVEFVKYMTSPEVAERIFTKVKAMPPSTAIDYEKYINDSETDLTVKSLAEACKVVSEAAYQSPTARNYWSQDISDALGGKYAGLKDGSKSPEQVAEELDEIK